MSYCLDITSMTDRQSTRKPLKTLKCPTCDRYQDLLFYSCCLKPACQHCFTASHFGTCPRQFNKHKLVLSENSHLPSTACPRCEKLYCKGKTCLQCRFTVCGNCSAEVHSKGKFMTHHVTAEKQESKSSAVTEVMQLYGITNNMFQGNTVSARVKPVQTIRPSLLQQNNSPRNSQREKSVQSRHSSKQSSLNTSQRLEPRIGSLTACGKHQKQRTVLTDICELICVDCFDENKGSVSKVKMFHVEEQELACLVKALDNALSDGSYMQVSCGETFGKMKKELQLQYERRKDQLEEKYRNNLAIVEKWCSNSSETLQDMVEKAEQVRKEVSSYSLIDPQSTSECIEQLKTIYTMRLVMILESFSRMRREVSYSLDGFNYRVNAIPSQPFEELLKQFSVLKKRVSGNDENANRSQSKFKNLHTSRMSNTSTAQKNKRLETSVNPYDTTLKTECSREKKDVRRDNSIKMLPGAAHSNRSLFNSMQKQNNEYYKEASNPYKHDDSYKLKPPQREKASKEVKYIDLNYFMDKGKNSAKDQLVQNIHYTKEESFEINESNIQTKNTKEGESKKQENKKQEESKKEGENTKQGDKKQKQMIFSMDQLSERFSFRKIEKEKLVNEHKLHEPHQEDSIKLIADVTTPTFDKNESPSETSSKIMAIPKLTALKENSAPSSIDSRPSRNNSSPVSKKVIDHLIDTPTKAEGDENWKDTSDTRGKRATGVKVAQSKKSSRIGSLVGQAMKVVMRGKQIIVGSGMKGASNSAGASGANMVKIAKNNLKESMKGNVLIQSGVSLVDSVMDGSVRTKKKSDYMDLRDRMRKPVLNKPK